MNIVFGLIAFVFLMMSLGTLYHARWARRLPTWQSLVDADPSSATPVRCSVVVAARDEEDRIENTIRLLLAQCGVELEIIAVDDRSTDGTTEALQRVAKEDSRVRVRRIETLPEGWLGKCHACHVGASMATGDWILFTDADCWMKPDVLARALRVAAKEQVDHIALTPGVTPETAAGRAWHLAFLMSLANWISAVNRDKPKRYLGMGAFNLVRAETYRQCGGYQTLRLTVLDDVRLGWLVRQAGKRTRGFIGGDDVECHWGLTALSMVKIMEKNYFAAVDYRSFAALALGVVAPIVWFSAMVAPFTGTLTGLGAGLSLLSLMAPAWLFAKRLGWGFSGPALTPFIYPLLFYAVFNSAMVTLRQGGIRWRETFYSLETLRKGNVKPK